MTRSGLALTLALLSLFCAAPLFSQQLNSTFARDPHQPVDSDYTEKIHKYTTDPSFISPLVDYLPASKTVPTPAKVLGDVSRRARHAALRGRCVQVFSAVGGEQLARESLHHRP